MVETLKDTTVFLYPKTAEAKTSGGNRVYSDAMLKKTIANNVSLLNTLYMVFVSICSCPCHQDIWGVVMIKKGSFFVLFFIGHVLKP